MDMNRFRLILRHYDSNETQMEEKVRDFYARMGMENGRELRNVMQIVRPLFREANYIIVEIPFADKEIGALSYKDGKTGYVFLNTALPEVNVNFALCHEIYHVFYQEIRPKQKMDLFLNEHYLEQEEELAANLFAGMLLMPGQSFRYMFRRFRNETGPDDSELTVLTKLMSYFEVPYMAVLLRCYELKLLDSGELLEELLHMDSERVKHEFSRLWLDERILKATGNDDYERLERLVMYQGGIFQSQGYLSKRNVTSALKNMRELYQKIKGD